MQIGYIDGPRLRRALTAGCHWAQLQRGELNRINVFPVPDGDTGTNLYLTVQAIADHLEHSTERSVGVVAQEVARAAVLGARGNCGMMLSHFLLGFARSIEGKTRIGASDFGGALEAGVQNLSEALEAPVEGTILTVMRDTARAVSGAHIEDIAPLTEHMLDRARDSLERTPELLPVLSAAGVVDAGAKGFVSLLEGVVMFLRGDPLTTESGEEFTAGPPGGGLDRISGAGGAISVLYRGACPWERPARSGRGPRQLTRPW